MIFSNIFSKKRTALPRPNETVNLQYERLEPLRVLNADYEFTQGDFFFTEGDSATTSSIVEVMRSDSDEAETVEILLSAGLINPTDDGIDFSSGPISIDFAVGEDSKFVDIEILGDQMVEADETIDLSFGTFSNGGQAGIQATSVLTIQNDDQTEITLTSISSSQDEGNIGDLNSVVYSVSLSNAVQGGLDVTFSTSDDTATVADLDYVDNDGMIFFNGDANEVHTFEVTIIGDDAVEINESISVSLDSLTTTDAAIDSSDLMIVSSPLGLEITNDDSSLVSIGDATVTELDGGTSVATFTVSLNEAIDTQISIDATTFDIGSANESNGGIAGDFDFVAKAETITFDAGTTTQLFEVVINGDQVVELNELFEVRLSNLQAAGRDVAIDVGTGLGTIENDDDAKFNIDDVSVTETDSGTTTATYTVSLTNQVDTEVTIDVATRNDSAVSGSAGTIGDDDYAAKLQTLTFDAGITSKLFVVEINGDQIVELDETYFVDLGNESVNSRNVAIDVGTGLGTIQNDDDAKFNIDDISVAETDSGTTTAKFTVSLTNQVDTEVTIDATTRDDFAVPGSAGITGDDDYVAKLQTLTFDAGITSKLFVVEINGDQIVELDETYFVDLGNESVNSRNVAIDVGTGLGTIQNDDDAKFNIDDVSVTETDSGTTTATYTVSLTNQVDTEVTIDVATRNDSAVSGSAGTIGDDDYAAKLQTLTFDAGITSKLFVVEINGDQIVELDETYFVELSNKSVNSRDVAIDDDTGLGTIKNDDNAKFNIDDISVAETDSGTTTAKFTVSLTNQVDTEVTIDVATRNDSAVSGSAGTIGDDDYVAKLQTLTFDAGITSKLFVVEINGDQIVELDETYFVDLSNESVNSRDVAIDDDTGLGTIKNDDDAKFNIDDISVAETDSGTTAAFTVSLTNQVDTEVTIDVATRNDSAVSGSAGTIGDDDYAAKLQMLTFDAGITSKLFVVEINGDQIVELDETYFVELSNKNVNSRDVAIDDDTGLGTIENDDNAIVSIDDVTQSEGDDGNTEFEFTVTLSNAVDSEVQFQFETEDGTAAFADSDYDQITATTRSFSSLDAGAVETISVTVNGDTHFENGANETFFLNLSGLFSNSRDVRFESNSAVEVATGTINNDDTITLVQIDASGNLVITDEVRLGTDDELTISFDAATSEIVVTVDSGQALLGTGAATGFSEIRFDQADVTGQIVIDTRLGDDVITVDYNGGSPLPPGGILYEGGTGGNDGLAIIGSGQIAVYTPDLVQTGSGVVAVDGVAITFSGLEPIDISGMALVTIVMPGADDVVDISNDTDFFAGLIEPAIRVSGSSNGIAFETVALWNNTSIVIDTTTIDGDDTVVVSGASNLHLNSNLTINTGGGTDTVSFDGNVNITGKLDIQSVDVSITPAIGVSAETILVDASNSVSQSTGNLTANELIVIAGGDVTLAGNNAVSNLAADVVGNFEFNNTLDLLITELTCGITVTGMDVGGTLDLTLTNANLTQDQLVTVDGITTVDVGTGNVTLTNANNDFQDTVNVVAANLDIVDVDNLTVGVVTASGKARLQSGGTLSLTDNVMASDVLLVAQTGVDQTGGTITATNLIVDTDGNAALASPNAVSNLAADVVGNFEFNNTLDLLITELTCGITVSGLDVGGTLDLTLTNANLTQDQLVTVDGITTVDVGIGDVTLTNANNDFLATVNVDAANLDVVDVDNLATGLVTGTGKARLQSGGTLSLTDNVMASDVLLVAVTGIDQTGGNITATNLIVDTDGNAALANANAVSNLAADVAGNFEFNNTLDLLITEITCGITVSGLDVGGTLDLTLVNANLTQDQMVTVDGITTVDVGTGNVTLTNPNNNFLDTVNVDAANLDVIDVDDLIAGVVTASGKARLQSGGTLSLTDNVMASDVLLVAQTGVDQAGGNITATNLIVDTDGDAALGNANAVSNLAADAIGNFEFNNTLDLLITELTCGITVSGLDVGGTLDLTLTNANLTQDQLVTVDGITTVDVGTGNVTLTNVNNDFQDAVNVDAANLDVVDVDNLATGVVTGTGKARLQSGGTLSLTDNVMASDVLLVAVTGIDQTGGNITATNLIVDTDGDAALGNANAVSNLAADVVGNFEFNNTLDLLITELTCGITVTGMDVGGTLDLTLTNANLTQDQLVTVDGITTVDVGIGDVTLTNANNDFLATINVDAANLDVVDVDNLATGVVTGTGKARLQSGGTLSLTDNVMASDVLLVAVTGIDQTGGNITATNLIVDTGGNAALANANAVSNLAADVAGNFEFNNTLDLLITGLTCGATTVTGANVGGTLDLTLTNANLTQDQLVTVDGVTTVDVGTGNAILTNPNNNFLDTVNVDAANFDVVDVNNLTAGVVTASGKARLQSGETLTLTNNVIASDVLLVAVTGIDQTGGNITATNLIVDTDGNAALGNANAVSNLAADVIGNFEFNNTLDLLITELTCGITVSGLDVGGTLDLTLTNANLTQDQLVTVDGITTVDVGAANVTLTNPNNNFLATVNVDAANLDIIDVDNLTAGVVTASGKARLQSGGTLSLTDNVMASDVLLVAQTGVDQTGGNITATNLIVDTDGDAALGNANAVSNLAADVVGNFEFNNTLDLLITELTCGATTVMGANVGGTLDLTLTNANLTQDQLVTVDGVTTVDVGAGNVTLTNVNNDFQDTVNVDAANLDIVDVDVLTAGVVTASGKARLQSGGTLSLTDNVMASDVLLVAQTGVDQTGGAITATNLIVDTDGNAALANANAVSNLAADVVGNFEFNNTLDLLITELTCGITVTGMDVGGTLDLTLTNANLTQDQLVTVDGITTVDVGIGDVTLTNANNDFLATVNVDAANLDAVDVDNLATGLVTGTGKARLQSGGTLSLTDNVMASDVLLVAVTGIDQTGGNITATNLIVDTDGNAALANANAVSNLAADVAGNFEFNNTLDLLITEITCGITVSGLDVGGTLDLTLVNANLTQDQMVTVDGITTVDVGTGNVTLTNPNNNFLDTVNVDAANLDVINVDDLIAGVVTASGKARLQSGGTLSLTDNVMASDVLLVAVTGINQTGGNITATNLIVDTDGNAALASPNAVSNLAADVAGNFEFSNTLDLLITELTCGATTVTGANVGGTLDLTLTNANLTQDQLVTVDGVTTVDVGTGNVTLTNVNNDFQDTVNVDAANLDIVDVDNLTVGVVTASGKARLQSGGTLSLTDNVMASDVLLVAVTGIDQTGGNITATNLIVDTDGDAALGNANAVSNLAADVVGNFEFNNTLDLLITELTCGITVSGLDVGGTLDLTLTNANLTQDQLVTVDGITTVDAGSGDVTLTNANNDFLTTVNVDAANLDVVDVDNLTSGVVTASGKARLQSGATLSLTDNFMASDVLLVAVTGIDQTGGNITATNLIVDTDGDAALGNANAVSNLAADVVGNFEFNNTLDLLITELTCGITVSGLDVGGTLDLTLVNANLTQDQLVTVTGVTMIDAGSGDVTLTNANNDFLATVNVDAANLDVVDVDNLATGVVTGTGKARLQSGGTLSLTDNVMASDVLVVAVTGIDQAGGNITATNLIVDTDGNAALASPNAVSNLAADVVGNFEFNNTLDLLITGLTCGATTVTGANVGGTLDLTLTNANLTQDQLVTVDGVTTVDVGTGNVILTNPNNNFLDTVNVDAANLDVVDVDDLTAGVVTASGKARLQSGETLTLTNNVMASDVLLVAVTGINQTGGNITATNLIVDADGNAALGNANAVSNLAADVVGNFEFNNTLDLLITGLTCGATTVTGANVGGTLDLTLTNANLTQDQMVTVDGITTVDVGTGDICLACVDALGNSKNDFGGAVSAVGNSITIQDRNQLTIGNVVANSDAAFRSGVGGTGGLILTGIVETSSINGQVLLQSDSGAVQQAGKVITSELVIGSETNSDARGGNFILTAANEVERLASRTDGSLSFTNAIDFEVADITFVSTTGCVTDVNVTGIDSRGNFNITLVDANITQTAAVRVTGTTTVNVVDGNDADVVATGHVCFSGGDSTGDGINNNDFNSVTVINATDAEFADVNNLNVLSANVDNQLRFWTGAGFQADGITPSLGTLTLSGDVSGFGILLQSSNGVVQAGGGITASELMLGGDNLLAEGTGDFILLGSNRIDTLSANLDDNLSFRTLSVFEGGVHTFMTDCGTFEFIEGIRVRTLIGVSFALTTTVESGSIILQTDEPDIENVATTEIKTDSDAFDNTAANNDQVSIEAELVIINADGTERLITKLGKDEITPDDVEEWKEKIENGAEFRPGVYRLRWSVAGVPFYVDFEKEVDEDSIFGLLDSDPDQLPFDFQAQAIGIGSEQENPESHSSESHSSESLSPESLSPVSTESWVKAANCGLNLSQDGSTILVDGPLMLDGSTIQTAEPNDDGDKIAISVSIHDNAVINGDLIASVDTGEVSTTAEQESGSDQITSIETIGTSAKILGAAAIAFAVTRHKTGKTDMTNNSPQTPVSF